MMLDKSKQLVVISGATSGIGLSMSKAMLEQGYQVLGIARELEQTAIEHKNFSYESMDIANISKLQDAISQIVSNIDIPVKALINNAGLGKMGNLEQLSVNDIRLVMDTNFISHAIITKSFLPLLKKQGYGDIIFTGSEAALKGSRQGSIYCASKFAVRGFAQALREECGKSGVRVTIINPGAVRTPFFDELHFEPGSEPENAIEPDDIAEILVTIIEARLGTVFDEITLSPLNHVWQRK
ncbi:MAG: short-chain dehydrogenase [SAR86 cluster bacterium]|uniref:Short-chain dehydrogenase n=1 Tax=SAR86 cluster bacterium TaxID=2030880 RepID=A0A2A5AZM2_9GAMM|nr:MAG: short-chain dehydrogenase [SAR86 cluster bacterium]